MSTTMNQPVAPPTPAEVQRKLSVKSTSPVPITPGGRRRTMKQSTPVGVSSAESDSDGPSGSYFSPPQTTAAAELATSQPPLNTITERLNQSGEESDDDDDLGDWQAGASVTPSDNDEHNHDDVVIKSGYLWKKGERRKTWKKRWFVLRTAKLAVYKTEQEYVLLRILDMHDVHSATVVALKRHINTFALVTPSRTYYLQAEDTNACHAWVKALNEVRTQLREADFTPLAQTPRHSTADSLPTSLPTAPTTIAGRRSTSTAGKSGALPSIVTSSPTPDGNGVPGSTTAGGRLPNWPRTPTSPIGMSSDEDDPFIASHSPSMQRRLDESNQAAAGPSGVVQPPPPLDPNHVVISGYLMKCGSKRKTWHKRWFMLTADRLAYSKSHIDTKHTKHVPLTKVVDAIEFAPNAKHGHTSQAEIGGGGGGIAIPGTAGGAPGSLEKPSSVLSSAAAGQPSSYGGTSALSESGVSSIVGSASSQPKNTFKIITTQRPFLLSAPSEEEEIKWLSAVRALIARRSSSS